MSWTSTSTESLNSSLSRFFAILWIYIVHSFVHSQMCLLWYYSPVKTRPRCHLLHTASLVVPIESYFLFSAQRVPSLAWTQMAHVTYCLAFGVSWLIHLMHWVILEIRDQALFIFMSFWMPCTRETFSKSLFMNKWMTSASYFAISKHFYLPYF